MFAEAVRQSPPGFAYVDFLAQHAGYTIDGICGDAGEMVVTLTDRLGPEILTVLEIKGQVLHLVRLHVKVSGWLFLSRLNEMSGGRENMCLVSGSLWRILKFLKMTFLIARFCGW